MATLFTPFFQPADTNGKPLAGAKLWFYQTGTSTPLDTYTSSGLTTPNSNPVVADSAGRFGPIYLGTTADYKVILTTSAGVGGSPAVSMIDPLFALSGSGRTVVADAAYALTVSDRLIAYTSLTASRTVTLTSALSFPAGTRLLFVDESGSASSAVTISLAPNGTDTINGVNATTVIINSPRGSYEIESDGISKWTAINRAPALLPSGVRQTVAAGPVDTAGLPTFFPATNAALSITTQNVTPSAALIAYAANGWSGTTGLAVDVPGYTTASLTWSGLTASRAAATPNYLYGTISGSVITPASTILAPIYQWGGTPSVTNGQITFNISEMKAYLGNGTTAPQTNLVVFGEAATDGTTVISTVAYAYNGAYESGFTATLPNFGTFTSVNHNIGVTPRARDFIIECTTNNANYVVGDQLLKADLGVFDGTTLIPAPLTSTRNAMGITTGAASTFSIATKTAGTEYNISSASWKYKFLARRGW